MLSQAMPRHCSTHLRCIKRLIYLVQKNSQADKKSQLQLGWDVEADNNMANTQLFTRGKGNEEGKEEHRPYQRALLISEELKTLDLLGFLLQNGVVLLLGDL